MNEPDTEQVAREKTAGLATCICDFIGTKNEDNHRYISTVMARAFLMGASWFAEEQTRKMREEREAKS